ncbi:purine-cytosine permease family protein [Saccharopolyspora rosea]|uniref:Purine-cytosine permease family protein n=1 Tax=Saccharopolyspora rosea TaxID=524884 RepID=A0ABW3G0C0_9PSEU|nr:cytosine permease [Saccharopolyspora rosea]
MSAEPPSTGEPVYGGAVTKVEPFGVDHIPDGERHGKPASQFFVWFAANLNFPIMLLGFSATTLGLGFGAAVTAIGTGALVGALLMAVMSRMGVRLGVPQQIQARGPLGFFGNFIPVAYINVFAGIGWAAVTVILGTKALTELVPVPFWLGALVLTAVQLVVAVYGYNMIHFLERVLAIVLLVLFAVTTAVAITRGAGVFDARPAAPGYIGPVGGWITLAGLFFSFLVAWAPFASDYSRYLPDSRRNTRLTAVFTGLGNFVTVFWLGVVGALVAGSTSTSDSIAALHQLTGPFAAPALLAVTISALSQNFLNVYGGAISVQTLRIPVNRKQAVTIICALAYAISLWGATGTEAKFEVFLNLTAYFITPFAAVLLLDYHLGKRSDRRRINELYDRNRVLEWGFLAWGAGVLCSVPFWHSAAYTGAFATAHPEWGNIAYYVGAAAAALVYLATYRLPPLWPLLTRRPAREDESGEHPARPAGIGTDTGTSPDR